MRNVYAKAKHHGSYALPIIAPLLTAALVHSDDGSLSATSNHYDSFGVQIRFAFHGVPFKLRHTGRTVQTVILQRGAKANVAAPALLTFKPTDDPAKIEPRLRTALLKAVA